MLAGLPPSLRAQIAWLPNLVRQLIAEPLRRANPREFLSVAHDVVSDAVPRLVDIGTNLSASSGGSLASAVDHAHVFGEWRMDDRIRARLEPHDVVASDQLREAWAWFDALVAAFARDLPMLTPSRERRTAEEIRDELRGPMGVVARGVILTMAAVESVLDEQHLPPTIDQLAPKKKG